MGFLGFLFDQENLFGRIMGRIWITVASNLLFIFFSLPVLTIGSSFAALCYVMLKNERSRYPINPVKEFWIGFRNNFRPSVICWMASAFFYLFLFADIMWCRSAGGLLSWIEPAIWVIGLVGIIFLLYLFPVIAAFKGTIPQFLHDAVFFLTKNLLIAVCVGACHILPILGMVLDEENRPAYAFIYFFIGFGLQAMISCHLQQKIFAPYLVSRQEDE